MDCDETHSQVTLTILSIAVQFNETGTPISEGKVKFTLSPLIRGV